MSKSVHDIENAIRQLPEEELQEFRTWYAEFEATQWDAQLEQDTVAGKLDSIADSAIAEHRAGKSTQL